MTSTPSAIPAEKTASTTNTSGACHTVPKKKCTDTTCWLFSAKANSVKKMAALSSHSMYFTQASVDVLEAIIQLGDDRQSARDWYVKHLERQPSLLAASRWIAGERFENEQPHKLVQRALDQATKPLMRYRCAACGFEATQHFWHCPGCQAWDSYSARRIEEL